MISKFYVYGHINPQTGEVFYIGKGSGNRKDSKYKRSIWWNNYVNKYGFESIIFEENLTEKDALEIEKYWIDRIGRKHLGTGPLINMTGGGDGTTSDRFISEEFIIKCSNRMKGNKINNGRKHCKSINDKKGKKGSKNVKAKKVVYNNKEYGCIKDMWLENFSNDISYHRFTARLRNNKGALDKENLLKDNRKK
jgi:hypothetical protein